MTAGQASLHLGDWIAKYWQVIAWATGIIVITTVAYAEVNVQVNDNKQTIMEKLQEFADSHNDHIAWVNPTQKKFLIEYNYGRSVLEVDYYLCSRTYGVVYFTSEEIAHEAIHKFKKELLEYFERG